jgi:uncharacterized protein YjeT (DUF2065 family)
MSEQAALSILRLLGITTVLVGVILTAQSLFSWLTFPKPGHYSALGEQVTIEGMVGDVARAAATCNALIIVLGFLFCALSPTLARYVAGRMPSN